jgi:hypothetical protein
VKRNFFDTIVGPLYHSLTTQAAVLHRVETIESTTGGVGVGGQLFFDSLLNIIKYFGFWFSSSVWFGGRIDSAF